MGDIHDDLRPRGAGRPNEFNMYVLESKFENMILRISSIHRENRDGFTTCGFLISVDSNSLIIVHS